MTKDKEQYEKIRQMVEKAAQRDKKHNKRIGRLDMICFCAVPLVIIITVILLVGKDSLNDILRLILITLAINLVFLPKIIKDSVSYNYMKKHGGKTNALVSNAHRQLRAYCYDATFTYSGAHSTTVTRCEYRPWLKPKNGDNIEIMYLYDNPNGFIWLKQFKANHRSDIAICITLNVLFLCIWLAIR